MNGKWIYANNEVEYVAEMQLIRKSGVADYIRNEYSGPKYYYIYVDSVYFSMGEYDRIVMSKTAPERISDIQGEMIELASQLRDAKHHLKKD